MTKPSWDFNKKKLYSQKPFLEARPCLKILFSPYFLDKNMKYLYFQSKTSDQTLDGLPVSLAFHVHTSAFSCLIHAKMSLSKRWWRENNNPFIVVLLGGSQTLTGVEMPLRFQTIPGQTLSSRFSLPTQLSKTKSQQQNLRRFLSDISFGNV